MCLGPCCKQLSGHKGRQACRDSVPTTPSGRARGDTHTHSQAWDKAESKRVRRGDEKTETAMGCAGIHARTLTLHRGDAGGPTVLCFLGGRGS